MASTGLMSTEEQGLKMPKVKEVVVNAPPTAESPYYNIPGGDLTKAWMSNVPDYTPAYSGWQQQDYRDVPNYEKLSRGERWIMDHLPGFAESDVGKALEWFNNTWAGKALQYIDIPAEGLERSVGLFTQAALASADGTWDEFQDQIQAAWFAGSLASDMANMKVDYDPATGRFSVPQDLGGMSGVVAARQYIAAAIARGEDPGQALIEARDAAYNNAGALALRMQLNDAAFHIFADPLNVVMPYIKPVERSFAAGILRGRKAIPEEVARITTELGTGLDIAKAEMAALEQAGEAAGAAKYAEAIAEIERKIAEIQSIPQIGPWGQRFLRLTGQMPGEKPFRFEGLLKPLNLVIKPFQLTAEARAYEYVDNVQRNLLAYVVNASDDPQAITRQFQRLADGVYDPQIAHMLVTPEGRAVRGAITAIAAKATDMQTAFDATVAERKILEAIANSLGDTPVGVMNRLSNGEAATVVAKALENADAVPEAGQALDALLGAFGHSRDDLADFLGGLPSLFKNSEIYSADLFRHTLTNAIADVAAEAGVAIFGVKARGMLQAASETLKAAESLAFLKLNPAYPVMNWVNNNMTMLARGTFGDFALDFAEGLWKELGYEPPRLRAGIGIGGKAVGGAEEVVATAISKAAKGEPGWSEKIAGWFKGRNLGKFDMGTVAREVERKASIRAYTAGYLQGHSIFSKKLIRTIRDFDPQLASALGDDLAQAIDNAARSARTGIEFDAKILGDNLNMSMRGILNDASRRLGYNVEEILTPEFTASVSDRIIKAAQRGPTALAEEMVAVRARVQSHIDNLVEEAIGTMIEQTLARVKVEGPGAFSDIWAGLSDEFYAAHPKHSDNVARVVEAAEAATDPKIAHVLWTQGLEAENAYMNRMWNRLEAYITGMQKGGREIELGGEVNDIARQFRKWRNGWQGFFEWRNATYDEFFRKNLTGKPFRLGWDEITTEADARYTALIDMEDEYIGRIDQLSAQFIPDEASRARYIASRDRVAQLRRLDRELVKDFMARSRGLSRAERKALMDEMWQQRQGLWATISQEEKMGKAAMQGNAEAQAILDADVAASKAATAGAEAAPEAAGATGKAPEATRLWSRTSLGDFHEFVPEQQFMGTGVDQLWYTQGDDALRAIEEAAGTAAAKKPLKLADVPPELQSAVQAYLAEARRGVMDTNYAAMRFAEWKRDSALLNYNRRYNYNTWLGTLAPYEFWATQSMYKWALHSIDRPAMLSTFLRSRKFLETAYRPEAGLPERLRGSIRVRLPFMPDWMGDDLFVDPLKMLLPFDRFAYPFETALRQKQSDIGQIQRVLEEMQNDGMITEQEYNEALQLQSGPVWDRAEGLARLDDTEGRKNGIDLMTMMVQPHAPIMWAYNVANGTPENIQPFLPITRDIKGLTGLLGIGPAGGYNPEAAVRRALGLPAFDQWDDYRVDRMLVNMAADGTIPVQVAKLAMIERNKTKDPQVALAFETAQRRASKEFGLGAMGSIIGLPMRPYPVGEERVREMREGYEDAWRQYENGNPKALTQFYDANPEYEARLALFKKPDERLRAFLVDELWNTWNGMPKLDKDEAELQLGQEFSNMFLNKDTRAYDMIPLDQLQMWVTLIGGKAPGVLEPKSHLSLPPAQISNRAQVFYNERSARFPNWYQEQQDYYKLNEGAARRAYRAAHPQFAAYQNWRRDWLLKNPDVATYLTDEPPTYKSEAELRQAQAGQPGFSWQEWQRVMGDGLSRLVLDNALYGDALPQVAQGRLDDIADEMGLPSGDAVLMLAVQSVQAP